MFEDISTCLWISPDVGRRYRYYHDISNIIVDVKDTEMKLCEVSKNHVHTNEAVVVHQFFHLGSFAFLLQKALWLHFLQHSKISV
jgi:hypothetical protein